ncbi:nucleotidyltransferase domain-containing protein [Janthinobacterium sp. GB1R12]|uniref:anti-phage Hailong system nucleotidyltransferase HalB n=1 Tax=Janthinobacterium sp. GB1R12 TaxID=3424190 RepID=UPI003F29EA61
MSILTLLLYGSRARGDETLTSDVDLLAITDEINYRAIANGSINTVCYPKSLVIQRARDGDLFLLHIVSEAKILYDELNLFDEIKFNFTYKENYKKELLDAANLGWMLINIESSILNYTLLNRRIAWCVRTILISKSADIRNPIFSLKKLKEFSKFQATEMLIENKNSNTRSATIIELFRDFLESTDLKEPINFKTFSQEDYQKFFHIKKNEMALKTLKMLTTTSQGGEY